MTKRMIVVVACAVTLSGCKWMPFGSSGAKPSQQAPQATPQQQPTPQPPVPTEAEKQAQKKRDAAITKIREALDAVKAERRDDWRLKLKRLDRAPMLLVCSDLQHYQALEEAQQKLGSHYDPLPAVAWADAGYEEEDAVALIRVKTEQVVKGLVNLYRVDVRRRMVAEPCPTPWLDKNKSLEFEDTNGIWKTLDDILSDYGADLKLAGETPASLSELGLQDYMAPIGVGRGGG